jgi:hypothetical protein
VGLRPNVFIFIFLRAVNIRPLWLSSNSSHIILAFHAPPLNLNRFVPKFRDLKVPQASTGTV